jgi:hypothetical protein
MKLTVRLGVFGAVPMGMLQDKAVKPNSLKVYIALSSFQGTNDSCFPGLEKIAERAGIESIPATSQAIHGLVETGWVEKIRRGKGLTNEYRCLAKLDEPGDPEEKPEKKAEAKTGAKESVADLEAIEREYFDAYSELFGEKPALYEYKKNRAIIKRRLKSLNQEQLIAVIQGAKRDRWAKTAGFTLGIVFCETMVNRYSRGGGGSAGVSDAELYNWDNLGGHDERK